MIKILIVEGMAFPRDLLANVANGQKDLRVVGAAIDSEETLTLCQCQELAPDLVLIDANAWDGAAFESDVSIAPSQALALAMDIRRELPNIKIVIMTAGPDIPFMDAARDAGVHSFVCKDYGTGHLLYVIRRTMSGRGIYPSPCR